jgi:Golgi phosphoprotein 3 (GPP34)
MDLRASDLIGIADPSGGYTNAVQNIGEDIVLLAIMQNGTIVGYEKLRFALAGAELVRLAEAGRIDIDHDGYISVLNASPTGDAITDLLLTGLEDAIRPPRRRTGWPRSPAGSWANSCSVSPEPA